MTELPQLSIVVPVFNEEGNLQTLYNSLSSVLKGSNLSYEIIVVDDGSTDQSPKIVAELNKKDPRVKLLSFSRNFGHMVALSAGLDFATGNAVITMDADLQHPPELIPELVKRWRGGAEIVNTIRKDNKGAGIFKKTTAAFFYWLMNRLAGIKLPSSTADYRLLDRKVVEAFKSFHERARFLRGLISWVGFKQEFVDYQADKRFAGRSKYSIRRMLAFAIDGIVSFSSSPLRLSTYLGLLVALVSFLYIIYAVYIRLFTNRAIEGWASVLVAVLFIGGIQLIFLGIIGEYLARVYEEAKQRPLYIISKKIGLMQ
jgi:glycosyltransferase involved in cell wall biosynthesis